MEIMLRRFQLRSYYGCFNVFFIFGLASCFLYILFVYFSYIFHPFLFSIPYLEQQSSKFANQHMLQNQQLTHEQQKRLRKAASNSKLQHNSLHARKSPNLTQHCTPSKLTPYLLPMLKSRSTTIPIYLLYKDQKLVIKCQKGISYQILTSLLYKQIIRYEANRNQMRTKQQVSRIVENVLGFSTVCNNLKVDYLMSIGEGAVGKSLLLECFMRKKGVRNGKKNQNQRNKGQSKENTNNSSIHSNTNVDANRFDYELYSCLAIGGFSKVYLARSYEDGNFYAIKFIKKKKQQENINKSSVMNQMQISSELNHPFVIKMKQGFQTNKFYCMVFQYCPGGQLFFLLKRVKIMSQEYAKFYFIQILLGIKYIHENNVLYRDLKPENILIDRFGYLKIVDFGLSKKVCSNRDKTFSYCGSAEYMAPQMILRSGHNASIDYYSLGALLYELVTGLPPFYSKSQEQLQQSIVWQELAFPSHLQLSQEIKDFLTHLLAKDQRYRLGSYAGIKQIMFHPWIGKFKAEQFLAKNPNLNVPYPPDLSKHNFDIDQLGDDQEEFTQQVNRDFCSKNLSNQLKNHLKNMSISENGQQINKKISNYVSQVFEQLKVEREKCYFEQDKRQQKIKTYTYHNQGSKPNRNTHKTIVRCQYSEQKQNHERVQASPFRQAKSIEKQTFSSPKSPRQKNQILLKSYRKLLPYFSKTKLLRPQKQKLPRANILKLKMLSNTLRTEQYLQNQLESK